MAEKEAITDQNADFITVAQAVQLAHSSEPTIRRKLTTGELQRFKFGGRTLIKKAELLSLIRPA